MSLLAQVVINLSCFRVSFIENLRLGLLKSFSISFGFCCWMRSFIDDFRLFRLNINKFDRDRLLSHRIWIFSEWDWNRTFSHKVLWEWNRKVSVGLSLTHVVWLISSKHDRVAILLVDHLWLRVEVKECRIGKWSTLICHFNMTEV